MRPSTEWISTLVLLKFIGGIGLKNCFKFKTRNLLSIRAIGSIRKSGDHMNLELSEEQQLLTNMVERFTSDHYGYGKRAEYLSNSTGYSAKNWNIMAETGLLGISFSEAYGGLNVSAEDLICIMQPIGKAVAVEPFLSCIVLAGEFLERAGTQDQKDHWIPKIIGGEANLALAHSEAEARFDLGFVKTSAKKNGSKATLNGKKTFILGAGNADSFIVSAILEGKSSDEKTNIGFYLVDNEAAGLSVRKYKLIDGSIGCEIELLNTPAEPMSGSFGDLLQTVSSTKIAACAELIGLMDRLFDETLDYVKTRQQFGRPLSGFQAIQHRLATAYANLELSKSHLLRLAALNESDENYEQMISGTKAYISKSARTLAEEAVQLHGGMGITDKLIIGHAMKRVILLSTLFGDVDEELRRYAA